MIFNRGDNSFTALLAVIRRDTTTLNTNVNNSINQVHSNPANMSHTAPQSIFGYTVGKTSQGNARHYTRRS